MAAAWVMALVGWLGVWLIPDTYQSRAQVFVKTENILEPVLNDVTARPDYARRVEVMQRALLTRPNVSEVVHRSGLDQTIDAGSALERQVKMEGMIDWVASKIKIDSPQPMYFQIEYGFSDPVIARNVVAAVLDLFIEQDLGASLQENEDARRKLDREIKRFEERLTAKDQEVAKFRRTHAEELALATGNQRKREQMETDLARIADELAVAKRRAVSLKSQLAGTSKNAPGDELDKLKVELAKLRSQYNENYPDILVVKARIAELEAAGAGVLGKNPEYVRIRNQFSIVKDQIAGLEEREQDLSAGLEALSYTLAETPRVEAELQRIIRDYEQTQKSYEQLVQSRDRLDLTTVLGPGAQGVEYQVLERPQTALTPAAPPRFLLIVSSLFLAFGVGAGTAMAMTFLDRSYTQTSELEEAFGLPVLGGVGVVSSDHTRAVQREDRKKLLGVAGLLFLLCGFYLYWEVMRLPSHGAALSEASQHNAPARSAETVSKEAAPWG